MKCSWGCVAAAGWVVLCLSTTARAQDRLSFFLDPRLGRLETETKYGVRTYPKQGVKRQPGGLGFTQQEFSFFTPVFQNDQRELSTSLKVKALDFDGGTRLPATGDAFPQELWDIKAGMGYRQRLDDGWIAGGMLDIGSASDQPFATTGETTLDAIGFLRIPHEQRNAWIFILDFSTELDRFREAPLPGAAYFWQPREQFCAVIGFPFVWGKYCPVETVELKASYRFPDQARAKASVEIAKPLTVFVGYDWDSQRFIRRRRADRDDRLFYYEQRITSGLRWEHEKGFWIEATGGYTFNRMFFEGEDFDDRDDNRVTPGDGTFVGLEVGVRF